MLYNTRIIMKIGIDIQTLINRPTGVGCYVNNLVEGLLRLDGDDSFRLFYFDFKRRYRGDYRAYPRAELKPMRALPGGLYNLLSERFGGPDFSRFCGRCDLYHFPNFVIPPLGKGKTVVTVHDLSFARFPHYTEERNLRRLQKRFPYTLERADAIIAVSEFTKRELIELYRVDPSRITVIYEGVTPPQHVPQKRIIDEPYFLFVGTVEPRKNLSTLLDAWKILKQREGNGWRHKLVIAGGSGWRCEPAHLQARKKGLESDVIVLDYVPHDTIAPLYRGAEALVYPSLYEGFGLPPLEAMASGTAVIAADAPAIPEIVGDAAFLVDPHSAGDIAEALLAVRNDSALKNDLIRRGEKRIRRFRWKDTAANTMRLYRSL